MLPDPKEYPTEFDRSGRGFPNFGYRLRKLEQRVRQLEGARSPSPNTNDENNRRRDAEHTMKESIDEHSPER